MQFPHKKRLLKISLFSLMMLGLIFITGNSKDAKADTDEMYRNIEVFTEVLRLVEDNYVESKDAQELIYGAIKGMMESLDPHSTFMTKEEHNDLMTETKGSFTGVGMEITVKDKVLTVVSPIEDTPAYNAGIKSNDKIIRIDDKATFDMTSDDAVKLIRGPKGSVVKITISRDGIDKPLVFNITRDIIPLRSVRSFPLDYGIGYVRISTFQGNTADELEKALDELEREMKLKGLILDLRSNPGGLLTQAVRVSNEFLDSGIIVSTRGRSEEQNMVESAQKNGKSRTYPLIVVVNEGSASASEIVAGALQDNKRALILGTRTFGKGSVQTILPLSDGSGLRLTTARYYTPSGKSIQVDGITPDIEMKYSPVEEEEEEEVLPFMREGDLEGHMENELVKVPMDISVVRPDLQSLKVHTVEELGEILPDVTKEGQSPADNDKETNERDTIFRERLKRDNQILQAVQILKSWDVITGIRTGDDENTAAN